MTNFSTSQLIYRDRYPPQEKYETIMTVKGRSLIAGIIIYSPHKHPSILVTSDLYRVDIFCTNGITRSFGFKKAWIDSYLKIRVSGYPNAFEEVNAWEIAPKE